MTDTEVKLSDAKIQLGLALDNFRDSNVVRSCINAFISFARSVTFSMQKESAGSERCAAWYKQKQQEMKTDPLLRFFNEQRRISIHERSVTPNRRTAEVRHVYEGDKIVSTGGSVTKYQFEGYSDLVRGHDGNVFSLCGQYYSYLETLVQEWLQLMK